MKIRTDFVSNSSSSSFCLEIKFTFKEGNALNFTGEGATGETGPINYFNGEARIEASPKYLGMSKDINELIARLADGVFDVKYDWDKDENIKTKIFDKPHPVETEWGDVYVAYDFVEEIKKEIKSIDEIKSISVSGTTRGIQGQFYKQEYKYDLETKKYTGEVDGREFESEGSAGEIAISDLNKCIIKIK